MGSRTNTQPSGGKAAEEEKQMSTYMFGVYRPRKGTLGPASEGGFLKSA